jgi:hypothetical protein
MADLEQVLAPADLIPAGPLVPARQLISAMGLVMANPPLPACRLVPARLAFALIWTPLVRRCAAIILVAMFTSAALQFGKLDVIGHTLIVVVLLAIVGDNVGQGHATRLRHYLLVPVTYGLASTFFLGIYYGAHAALFGTTIF